MDDVAPSPSDGPARGESSTAQRVGGFRFGLNYMDGNVNVCMPVFAMHGNHGESGEGEERRGSIAVETEEVFLSRGAQSEVARRRARKYNSNCWGGESREGRRGVFFASVVRPSAGAVETPQFPRHCR